jgi:hypothetical protein
MIENKERDEAERTLKRLVFGDWTVAAHYAIGLGVGTLVIFSLAFAGAMGLVSRDVAVATAFGVAMSVVSILRDRRDAPERALAQHIGLGVLKGSGAGITFYLLMVLW